LIRQKKCYASSSKRQLWSWIVIYPLSNQHSIPTFHSTHPVIKSTLHLIHSLIKSTLYSIHPIIKSTFYSIHPIIKSTLHLIHSLIKSTFYSTYLIIKSTWHSNTQIIKSTFHSTHPLIKSTRHSNLQIIKSTFHSTHLLTSNNLFIFSFLNFWWRNISSNQQVKVDINATLTLQKNHFHAKSTGFDEKLNFDINTFVHVIKLTFRWSHLLTVNK